MCRIPSLAMILLFITSCTSNPVGGDETPEPNRTIKGSVRLGNELSPSIAHIWFDALDMSQKPDPFGVFSYTLPPPASQNQAGGLDGAFHLYFYVANCNFVNRTVIIRNGAFLFETADLNAAGTVFPEVLLNEQLRIRTVLEPDNIEAEADSVHFSVEVNLYTFRDTVDVFFPTTVADMPAPMLCRNRTTDNVIILPTTITNTDTTDFKRITTNLVTRKMDVHASLEDLPAGDYEVIPYLLVQNPEVPREVIDSIGLNVEEPGPDYLKIPFIRFEGGLVIVAASGGPWQ